MDSFEQNIMTKQSSTAEIRARLEEYQASIVSRRERLAKHVHHREEPLPQDFAEQAVEMENSETMVALEDELSEQEREVAAAVDRCPARPGCRGRIAGSKRCSAGVGEIPQ